MDERGTLVRAAILAENNIKSSFLWAFIRQSRF